MKYFDKNTLKTQANWHKKQFEDDSSRHELKQKNAFKKALRSFSYTIEDKFWWNSLDFDTQSKAFRSYYSESDFYWFSNHSINSGTVGFSGYGQSYSGIPQNHGEEISAQEHLKRVERLKEMYHSRVHHRRELVINEILKSL